jgi:tight adherence protein C
MALFHWLPWICCFITVACLVYGSLHYASNRRFLKERFNRTSSTAIPLYQRGDGTLKKRFLEWISSVGKFAMKDKEDTSKLRFALIQGGFRHPKGTAIFFGIQALGACSLPLPFLLINLMGGSITAGSMVFLLVMAGVGFYLPQYVLKFITSRRKDRIDKALPDVLDMLIVCVEAGLSLQATLNRVSDEVRNISLDMYNELHLTNAELRTGITRETALKNMGERTGVQNVKALMAMLIQSEKMGTGIAQALRVHAAYLRVQRSQRAEEVAAKLPVKILIPMLLFIFPAVFIVVLGPAAINMMKSSFFKG